jgi:hypothetical protein
VFHVNDKILWPAPVEIEMFPQPVQVLALKAEVTRLPPELWL